MLKYISNTMCISCCKC